MSQEAYAELEQRVAKSTITIKDSEDEQYECYKIEEFPNLAKMVTEKFETVKFVNVELLINSEDNIDVFNLMFFNENNEHVAGCELVPTKVYWDDDM